MTDKKGGDEIADNLPQAVGKLESHLIGTREIDHDLLRDSATGDID
jgi:hypothetical protein